MMVSRSDEILRAAQDLFLEGGVEAVSVRSVATRAGVGASTLRHYFPSQRALFDAILASALHSQLDDADMSDGSVPPLDRLTTCVAQFLPRETTALTGWLQMYWSTVGPDGTPQGRAALESLAATGRSKVEGWLRVLANEGLSDSCLIPTQTTLILTIVDGLCLQLLTPGAPVTLESAVSLLRAALKSLVLDGASAVSQ